MKYNDPNFWLGVAAGIAAILIPLFFWSRAQELPSLPTLILQIVLGLLGASASVISLVLSFIVEKRG